MKTQFIIAGIMIILIISITDSLNADEELKVNQIAPSFILKTLDGSKVVRSKNIFSEKKLTVLIFWDSYCPDCLETLSECQKFYQHAKKLDVVLWSINFDKEENLPQVRSFLTGEEITFPILSDPLKVTVKKYKAEAYDFSLFIIDKRRVIRYVCYDHPPKVGEVIQKAVEKILKEGLKVSKPAPDFILKTLDGKKVVRSKKIFPQNELTVLIFWNSKYKKCLDAIVEVQKFYKKSEKLNVGVLSINFDQESEKTKNFVEEKELTFPTLSDIPGVAAKLYKVEDYCFSVFIVDKEGIVRYISYESTPNIAEIIEAEIEKMRQKDEK